MKRAILGLIMLCNLFSPTLLAQSLIAKTQSNYLPQLPPISIATMTSRLIKVKALKKNRFQISIPGDEIINLAITRNKNPVMSELFPGSALRQVGQFIKSNNNFEKTPVDGQVIIDGEVQSIKITGFNFTPQGITLIAHAFNPDRPLQEKTGAGTVVVNSSCIVNRAVCALGCTYVILPDVACRKKLGLL